MPSPIVTPTCTDCDATSDVLLLNAIEEGGDYVALPPLDAQGLLPVSPNARHAATVAEIEALFVTSATSHAALRRDVWDAYLLWERRVVSKFGHGEVWLAGTFVTNTSQSPELRTVFFPKTPSMVGNAVRSGDAGLGLLTLSDVFYMAPAPGGTIEALRSVGGIIDSQIGSSVHSDGWDAMWSVIADSRRKSHTSAGYVSVTV